MARTTHSPIEATPKKLEKAAYRYLERYASSVGNLRALLMRKVHNSARVHGSDPDEGARAVERILRDLQAKGVLNDALYAEGRAAALRRRGLGGHMIRMKLAEKGVSDQDIDTALAQADDGQDDPELTAALALAKRRRLGPFRPLGNRPNTRKKDLAALARAGFSLRVARAVMDQESE